MSQSSKTAVIVAGIILLVLVSVSIGVFLSQRTFGFPGFLRNYGSGYGGGCSIFSGQAERGWFWNFGSNPVDETLTTLTIEQAEEAVNDYISRLGYENLELGEIMIFSNHAYAEIMESDTGIGAMEVIVDPTSLEVFPEQGPNMMWNLKYGHMGGRGIMDRSFATGLPEDATTMPISPEEAVQIAQEYLNGMLNVNGYSGQVFLHTWHGDFIVMSEHAKAEHD